MVVKSVNLLEQVHGEQQPSRRQSERSKNWAALRALDFFVLLDAGGVDDPVDLNHADTRNQSLKRFNDDKFEQFVSLRSLDLTGNCLALEPLAKLPALQNLCLKRNRITAICPLLGKFSSLQKLDVSYNKLKAESLVALSTLPALRALNIDYNFVDEIPDQIGEGGAFPALQKLSAAGNGLHSSSLIPLSKMRRLLILSLPQNTISTIPDEIFRFPKPFQRLQKLDLSFNCLKEPSSLKSLRQLQELSRVFLWGNPVARNAGRPLMQHFLQARTTGQCWSLETPQPSRHPYERFSACFSPDYVESEDRTSDEVAASHNTRDNGKEEEAPGAVPCSFKSSISFITLKRQLMLPPTLSDLHPPHYMSGVKRPTTAPAAHTKHRTSPLLSKVRKAEAERQKHKPEVVLRNMQERLQTLEGGLSGLRRKLSSIL